MLARDVSCDFFYQMLSSFFWSSSSFGLTTRLSVLRIFWNQSLTRIISKKKYTRVLKFEIRILLERTHCLLVALVYNIWILPTLIAIAKVDKLNNLIAILRSYLKSQD